MLPIPKNNPLISLPVPTAEEFNNPSDEEDADLLATGAWDEDEADDEDDDHPSEGEPA